MNFAIHGLRFELAPERRPQKCSDIPRAKGAVII
jgi:hypothetical protein